MPQPGRVAAAVALVVALALAATGVAFNTRAVGGSDSSCHALMAAAFARGELQPRSAITGAPWPAPALTLAPGGFIPSPVDVAASSPVCAPGFSVLLAPLVPLHPDAIFLVTPAAGALLVLAAFLFTRRMAGPEAGAMAALLVATSPIVLFEVVQPTNDVTTAALWMSVVALLADPAPRRVTFAGAVAGLALLVRPNLLPIAAVCMLWLTFTPLGTRERLQALVSFALAVLPFGAAVLWLNARLYGSPFASGYGDVGSLFSASNVVPNVVRYGTALLETQTPLVLVGFSAPWLVSPEKRRPVVLAMAVTAVTVVLYLFYRSFAEWWYLRFLLPAVVMLCCLTTVAIVHLVRSWSWLARAGVFALTGLLLGVYTTGIARDRQAFQLQQIERRMRVAPEVVRDRLPANAVLITVWQSGSVRFVAGREAVLWDSLDPAWLDRAIEWLRGEGYEPYILVERREEPLFRERFGAAGGSGQLDWPPRFDIARQVRIYAPQDRETYVGGERVPTEYVF